MAALCAALAVTGCSKVQTGTTAEGRHQWTRPGVFRFAENVDMSSLNPVVLASGALGDLSMFIFSYAVRYDDHARPVPDAVTEVPTVENGDVSKDGLTLKYKLRHNIKWQDGQQLTCKDLRFTWQVIMNPKTNVATTDGFKDIKDVDCSDPYVAVVHMKRVYAPYLQQLWGVNGNAPILPEHLLAKYNDDKGSINTAPYNSMPIGSGPFKVIKWQRGTVVKMVANPDFYLGKPKLNEVDYYPMPDENTEATQVQTHEIDMLARGTGANWPKYQALAADPKNGLTAIRVDSFLFDHIDFNLENPILKDVNIRRAIAYATNRDEIIEKILHGSATKAETDQHPTLSWAHTDDTVHYPYDPEKAKQTLDAAGWKVGPGGIRVKNGQKLQFNLSTQTESTNGKLQQELLQREWRDIGIQADIKNYPTAQMFRNDAGGTLAGSHYDVATYAWIAAADPDESPLYTSSNWGPHGQNYMHWKNDKVDAAEKDGLLTVDEKRRKADYVIVQQEMLKDVPTIILSFRKEPYVYNSDLKNYTPSPVISSFWNPWEYSI